MRAVETPVVVVAAAADAAAAPDAVIGHGNEIRYIYEFISYISYYVNSYKGTSS